MTSAAVFFIAFGLTQILFGLVTFMVGGVWFPLPLGGVSTLLGVAFMIAAHRRRKNRSV
jgi:glucose dehydrogenase